MAYASRSLTSSEQNYCQLEKETLSIVFAFTKFHEYVYGKKIYVYNDHLPQRSIFKKSIAKAPARIQRFMLRLQRYDLEMHYIKGSLLTIPDTISRSSLKRDNRIVVPASMRKEMKNILHSGHLGIVKTKLRARDSLYWPGITKALENIIQNCETCQEFHNKQKKELLLKHEIPNRPWSKVGTDLLKLNSKYYLIIVDYTITILILV